MNNFHLSSSTKLLNLAKPSSLIYDRQKPWWQQILDPGSEFVNKWNHIFLFTCLVALFVDPLYFLLPQIGRNSHDPCMSMDIPLGVTVTALRCIVDLFSFLHMAMKFRTAYVAPSSRVFGRGELVMDHRKIAMHYLKSDFVVDLVASLPLPQIVIWFIIPAVQSSTAAHAKHSISLAIFVQYVPRFFVIFPLYQRILKTTGVVAKSAWAGAMYNLILYMLASHVSEPSSMFLGLLSQFLDCGNSENPERRSWLKISKVLTNCDASDNPTGFEYGMFANAFTDEVAPAKFFDKYFYCLWWGMRSLSSYGQVLVTSTYIGETLFSCTICLAGLVLFARLIGDMQVLVTSTYIGETLFSCTICLAGLVLFARLIGDMQTSLQSTTARLEEWRVKSRDTEEWMRHRQLPPDLQDRVRRFVQYKWLATGGVDEKEILHSLPLDIRRQIQRHLCLALVRRKKILQHWIPINSLLLLPSILRLLKNSLLVNSVYGTADSVSQVPFFAEMDNQLLDAICERLVSSLSTKDTYIVREGDPVNEMLFIIRGQLESNTTNGGRYGFFNTITLKPGDFCGEELLTWALMPTSNLNRPSSTRTVKSLTEVEAFALLAEDLKFVAKQFKRLHSKKLQHAFRYYSHQWRTWGSCFIQAAWRRYMRKKQAGELLKQESLFYMQFPDQEGNYGDEFGGDDYTSGADSSIMDSNAPHLGATILASKFAANTRRGLVQKVTRVEPAASSLKMPKLLKPDEPDFSKEDS
ncbi:unnamed protein product [Ilex paraguariensis]|uniref:Cyclic nucleotide-binding domain-containing protein n=1 Tax=Ilex paraguariensis TaxID=185542 RepID=A0ABC8TIV6_9AQUA